MHNEIESEINSMLSMAEGLRAMELAMIGYVDAVQRNPARSLFWARIIFLLNVLALLAGSTARKLRAQAIKKRKELEADYYA